MQNIQVGDRVAGRCVTLNIRYTGTVTEILHPLPYSGRTDPVYRLTDTGQHYSTGGPIKPIVECAERV